ncbi:MAG: hypothetical protein HN742_15955 [Lentisphaerae bacterium]|jgi:hypothetical protein|nr:hypothetical protein [Lentisphaerota bacterium]MBT4816534.1 hypothetical protein [Lentisphaerota bacterium]MBT7057745.1 hypothetical protein [Lentisphaerota bacterium]MBT7843371.1 hypothetical protein [Lentisphaerota bacterium]
MNITKTAILTSVLLIAATGSVVAADQGIVRGIYCHPGLALDNRLWSNYGRGYTFDNREKRSGSVSLRCRTGSDEEAQGAVQTVELNQTTARPIVVAGWAKLEGVAGPASYRCSVYVDLRLTDGKSWPMKIAVFDPEKAGWQYSESTHTPPAPITSARVYVFLREKAGTAWFDDIYVGEVLDGTGKRSANLLRRGDFEAAEGAPNPFRTELFDELEAMNCNALHFYRSIGWSQLNETDELPPIDPDDPLPGFIQAARERDLRSWLTVGLGFPAIKDTTSPNFPTYACVNNKWGAAYTKATAHFTRYGMDGIGVVPDEWTFTSGRLKRTYGKHANPEIAAHYKGLSSHVHCPICHAEFEKAYARPFPDMSKPWGTADPVWAQLLEFRYDQTAAWMQRTVAAAKGVNPDVVTDTMICVLPVCSDDRIGAGAAWDRVGATTQLDCLQTDPYILLHNYRGDSTHYYTTETTIHLTAANWPRSSGVTLEASRLRETDRIKDPAEVYGSALSCLVHGAREFFWWHLRHVTGNTAFVDAPTAKARVTACYEVMRRMESDVVNTKVPGDILVLYSRRSEDTWHWLSRAKAKAVSEATMEAQAGDDGKPQRAIKADERRGFLAHKNVLYWLMRRGYPFQTTFVEYPDPAKLRAAEVVVLPFPLALTASEAALVDRLARAGKTVIVMSELSPLNELGRPLPVPRLASLFGATTPDRDAVQPVVRDVGRGKVIFLGADAALQLFEHIEPQRNRALRVPLAAFNPALISTFEQTVGGHRSLLAEQPEHDVEVAMARSGNKRLLLAINWDLTAEATIRIRPEHVPEGTKLVGYSIRADATVARREEEPSQLRLAPQEAALFVMEGSVKSSMKTMKRD